jgi:hypothetical protein
VGVEYLQPATCTIPRRPHRLARVRVLDRYFRLFASQPPSPSGTTRPSRLWYQCWPCFWCSRPCCLCAPWGHPAQRLQWSRTRWPATFPSYGPTSHQTHTTSHPGRVKTRNRFPGKLARCPGSRINARRNLIRRSIESLLLAGAILLAGFLVAACGQSGGGPIASFSPSRSASISVPSRSASVSLPSPSAPASALPAAAQSVVAPAANAPASGSASAGGGSGSSLVWLWIVIGVLVLIGLIVGIARASGRRSMVRHPAPG